MCVCCFEQIGIFTWTSLGRSASSARRTLASHLRSLLQRLLHNLLCRTLPEWGPIYSPASQRAAASAAAAAALATTAPERSEGGGHACQRSFAALFQQPRSRDEAPLTKLRDEIFSTAFAAAKSRSARKKAGMLYEKLLLHAVI